MFLWESWAVLHIQRGFDISEKAPNFGCQCKGNPPRFTYSLFIQTESQLWFSLNSCMFCWCLEDFKRSYPKDYDTFFFFFLSNHARKFWFTLIEAWQCSKFAHSCGSTKCRWQGRSKDEKENLKDEMATTTTTTKIMLNRRAPFCPSGWDIIQEPRPLWSCSEQRRGVHTPGKNFRDCSVASAGSNYYI